MARTSETPGTDEWVSTRATITACKLRLLGQGNMTTDSYVSEYDVTFSYEANGQTFEGGYRTTSPQERGHIFDIFYDPNCPNENTGSDKLPKPWIRMVAIVVGVLIALVGIWLWEDQDKSSFMHF